MNQAWGQGVRGCARSPRALVAPPLGLAVAIAACGLGCGDNASREVLAGGDTTVFDRTSNAYSFPAPNLTDDQLDRHLAGDVAFEANFVTGGAPVNNGLGPVFNSNACGRCHGRDGRGMPMVDADGPTSQSLVRVSLADGEPAVPGGAVPVPGVGDQLQDHAVYGHLPEARVEIEWVSESRSFGDGSEIELRRPRLSIELAGGGALKPDVLTSLRQPPPVFGLGLLEAISEEQLEAWADPLDQDGDGISGVVNRVWDVAADATVVGRFGHKANQPTLLQQSAGAYSGDMGVSSPLFPEPDGGSDIDRETLELAAFYVQTLAVPERAPQSVAAGRGEQLFEAFGCASCHVPSVETADHPIAALAYQRIAPYTDLLLHDMGEDLADGRPDFLATGREWRTAPLWGIGLVQTVQPGAGYLHDGRARTLAEAILWHGGEAEAARESFRTASSDARDALLAFLYSL